MGSFAGLQVDWIRHYQSRKHMIIWMFYKRLLQTSQTRDQLYSNTSPYSERSLIMP